MNRITRKHGLIGLIFALVLLVSLSGCQSPVPHRVIPKQDIGPAEYHDPDNPTSVLVASRASEFKIALIDDIVSGIDESVFVRVTGVESLIDESADDYHAVVVISPVFAWTMDPDVQRFVDRFPDNANIIVVNTSSDGAWFPEENDFAYDALSSASITEEADDLASQIIELIGSEPSAF